MSEKRILIKEVIAPCNDCSGAGENVCGNCNDWDTWCSCLTREQTIEKMADAIQSVAVDRGGIDLDDDTTLDPRMFAEAALNALLEAENAK